VSRMTTKKGHQLFEEKVHAIENPGYAYAACAEKTDKLLMRN